MLTLHQTLSQFKYQELTQSHQVLDLTEHLIKHLNRVLKLLQPNVEDRYANAGELEMTASERVAKAAAAK